MIAMGLTHFSASNLKRGCKQILLIEDNEDDTELTRESISLAKVNARLMTASDFNSTKKILSNAVIEGQFPDFILLDLNLNGNSGFEILRYLKKHPELKRIPVIILTTSRSPNDVMEAYQLGASCFIRKPIKFKEFLHIIQKICQFWLTDCELPFNNAEVSSSF